MPASSPLTERLPTALLSKADAARFLAVSLRTIERLISEGKIRARRYGARVLVETDSCQAWRASLPLVTGPRPLVHLIEGKRKKHAVQS
jgi:excisionase family DNA binding protein